jgi:putative ABC transport system permease protein
MHISALPYSLAILWRDRRRFLAAVLAVAFSAVLITVQTGLLLGIVVCSSAPIDESTADIWVTTNDVRGLSLACPFPESWRLRVAAQPEIERTETYLLGTASWHRPARSSSEVCLIVGSPTDEGSLGMIRQLSPEVRGRLNEPGAVVVEEWDLPNLGLHTGTDEIAEINMQRVRVVGTIRGFQGPNFSYVFCSLQTARMLLPHFQHRPDLTLFVLARCRHPGDTAPVVERLRRLYPEMGVHASDEFSRSVRWYWLFRSKAGTVLVCTTALALLVGLVVTSQTLYAAVVASLREYAVLDALGLPRWRLVMLVLAESFWIGVAGLLLSLPVILFLSEAALLIRTRVLLPPWTLVATPLLTLTMALLSGAWALRPLRQVEPATLLR